MDKTVHAEALAIFDMAAAKLTKICRDHHLMFWRNEKAKPLNRRLAAPSIFRSRHRPARAVELLRLWPKMTSIHAFVVALACILVEVGSALAVERTPSVLVEDGIGKVTIDGVEMSFDMGKPYDLENKFEDDEPNLISVRKTSVYDDRGTFLAAVETLEERCRTEPYPMNVDLAKFRKLRANWLKNPATAANYKKAKKEFQSIQIDPTGDEGVDDFNWRGTCDEVNAYGMELKIFKHLPDTEWARFEATQPAWMNAKISGTYPYIDQVKFTAYKIAHVDWLCSSAPKINEDSWRLTRASRVEMTAGNANAEQTKDFEHYATLIDQAKQRLRWHQARANDVSRLAAMCSEYQGLVAKVNGDAAPAKNLPIDRIAKLYLVGVALREAQCYAGIAIVRNALEFARQNNQTENDIRTFALANNQNQLVVLNASVDASRRTGRLDETLRLMCEVAGSSSRFMGLPNPQ